MDFGLTTIHSESVSNEYMNDSNNPTIDLNHTTKIGTALYTATFDYL